jgi:hypothetical protein
MTRIVRRARPALLATALLTTGFGGLLALEHTTTAAAPPAQVITTVPQADTAGASAEHTRHCTDGHGKDAEKNKHCRDVSGAQ